MLDFGDFPDIPIIVEDDMFLYPFMITPIFINDDVNEKAVDYAIKNKTQILVVSAKDKGKRNFDAIYDVGVLGSIIRKVVMPNNKSKILFQGNSKVRIISHEGKIPLLAKTEQISLNFENPDHIDMYLKVFKDSIEQYNETLQYFSPDMITTIKESTAPDRTIDLVLNSLKLSKSEAYNFFIETSFETKLKKILAFINDLVEGKKVENEIKEKLKAKTNQKNRDFFLNEQLKILQKELEKSQGNAEDESTYEKRLELKKPFMSEGAYKEIKTQIEKFRRIGPENSEGQATQEYIEWALKIPFETTVEHELSLKAIRDQLDADHYSLDKPKDRIVEFFATKELLQRRKKGSGSGLILCFAGPPGVGKTSLANSIATALGRNLVRIALGGVDDVSELRGHRRTYVAAMPGRIVQGIINSKQMNPVVVLDEIDKIIGRTNHGNPEAAMLEILDPEQNDKFRDNYLNFDLDLSKVVFIATANDVSMISGPLRDRMEFIQLNSYTAQDKYEIARKYLIPQELEKHGLEPNEIVFNKSAIVSIIEDYTRESGVRNLRRKIAEVMRKIAVKVINGEEAKVALTSKNLKDFLDKKIFDSDFVDKHDRIGIVNGLAWTSVGGDTLKIEAIRIRGKGELKITGQLGDVMKESAQIAFSLVKVMIDEGKLEISNSGANRLNFGDEEQIYKQFDLHIHVPEGATPKDGPSAGITLLTAIASILSQRKVDSQLAMTGEITLSGKVLPIGGLKEKLIAAHKAKIKRVLVPQKNFERDLDEIPEIVRKELEIIAVNTAEDVLKEALI